MRKKIDIILDSLVPRDGETPECIYISLEEYLSRLSNLTRKLRGVNHRMKCWKAICKEHRMEFDRVANSRNNLKLPKSGKFGYSLIDPRLENEFEVLLYSILSTLSALTRVVACFLKSSTDFHSHSKLPTILLKHEKLKQSQLIVANACNLWADELTARRDAATHYVALTVTSSFERSKSNSSSLKKTVSRIAISKKPLKYVSLWEDILPTLGGSQHTSIIYDESSDIKEEHELLDKKNRLIVRRNSPLPNKPEVIDGEKFVQSLLKKFDEYVITLLSSFQQVIQGSSS